jgi:hypothetical protein
MIRLKWHGEFPDDLLEIEQVVRQDMSDLHEQFHGNCSKLIFHTVFLGEDLEGPIVMVWGQEGDDDQYHCEYDPNPDWQSFSELEDLEDQVD